MRESVSKRASERASEHVSSVCHHKLIIFPLSHRSSTCHHLSQRVCVSGHSGTSVTLCFQSPLNIHKKKKKKHTRGPQAVRLGELKGHVALLASGYVARVH